MHDVLWSNLVIAQAEAPPAQHTVWSLLSQASGMVWFVLIILVLSSIVSWFIIGYKFLQIRRASAQSAQFHDIFWQSKRLDEIYKESERLVLSPVSKVFQAGYVELRKLRAQDANETMSSQLGGIENVERALRRSVNIELAQLEQMTPFLATVGSTAPFIGLFGTVWGIMLAFMNLSDAAGEGAEMGINVVAGPIAEALIATAIGLMAAIPAVVAYNYFNARVNALTVEMESFTSDFLNIVKRHFFK